MALAQIRINFFFFLFVFLFFFFFTAEAAATTTKTKTNSLPFLPQKRKKNCLNVGFIIRVVPTHFGRDFFVTHQKRQSLGVRNMLYFSRYKI